MFVNSQIQPENNNNQVVQNVSRHPNDELVVSHAIQIAVAWCSKNTCMIDDIPSYLQKIYNAVANVYSLSNPVQSSIKVEDTIHQDYLICLEDGKMLKTLKRHLMSKYNMTLEEYKRKWYLPSDYPTVAANYAKKRSMIAQQTGRGKRKRENIEKLAAAA